MRNHLLVVALAPILALALAGCVNTTDALQIEPDTFTVSSSADGMRMAADARQSALQTAARKCASLGRNIVVLNETSQPTRMSIDTTINVNFRCVA
jgi:outer membrane murein-binding lipoprotein Lpp